MLHLLHQDSAHSFTPFQEVSVRDARTRSEDSLGAGFTNPFPGGYRPVVLTSGLQRP